MGPTGLKRKVLGRPLLDRFAAPSTNMGRGHGPRPTGGGHVYSASPSGGASCMYTWAEVRTLVGIRKANQTNTINQLYGLHGVQHHVGHEMIAAYDTDGTGDTGAKDEGRREGGGAGDRT